MPRPRRDGRQPRPTRKHKLTDPYVRNLKPEPEPYLVWDQRLEGFCIQVQPSGHKAYKCIYRLNGRPRWYTIGSAGKVDFDTARTLAVKAIMRTLTGVDVAAERKASRGAGTFDEIANRYLEEYAKKKNRSWEQADALVQRFLLSRWGKLRAADITRSDVKLLVSQIGKASVATQTIRAASAIFSWCIKEEIGGVKSNPCQRIDLEAAKSRERVLSDSEIPLFWNAFDNAGYLQSRVLRLILLLGQRPGEVLHMRREHIVDGWWTMPGRPVPELLWPGLKNSMTHRIWLPKPARAIVDELDGDGLLFAGARGTPVQLNPAMRSICAKLKVERATPHDLRRTHGTMICALGFGRDMMNKIQNHRDGGIGSVYDRHSYAKEIQTAMEAVANRIMMRVEGAPDNVVTLPKTKTA
jgi:integrase